MKRVCFMYAVCALMLATSGCGQKSSPPDTARSETGQQKPKLTVAVIPKSTGGEFWETVGQGARAAAADLGVNIKWNGTLTETEIAEQTKIIENM
ncbi:MAG: hypothetical protein J7M12_05450, partial [Candidatus Hydrogenedentes bacterium]|nr:hypothetical protein [Candidatus Hydrogenedentota bacterium]